MQVEGGGSVQVEGGGSVQGGHGEEGSRMML